MLAGSISLPFSMSGLYGGFGGLQGIVRLDECALVLEFEVSDAVLGLLKSQIKKIEIPLQEIQSARMEKGWFSATLTIRVNNLAVLSEVPGSEGGEAELEISRKDRPQAELLVLALNARARENGKLLL